MTQPLPTAESLMAAIEITLGIDLQDCVLKCAVKLDAEKNKDSIAKVIADMRMYYGAGPARGDRMGVGFADRLEALMKENK